MKEVVIQRLWDRLSQLAVPIATPTHLFLYVEQITLIKAQLISLGVGRIEGEGEKEETKVRLCYCVALNAAIMGMAPACKTYMLCLVSIESPVDGDLACDAKKKKRGKRKE